MKAKSAWKILGVLGWLLLAGVARGQHQSLTEDQYAILRMDMQNDPTLQGDIQASNDAVIAAEYNKTSSTVYWVWRTSVPRREILYVTSQDGTNFAFVDTGYIARTVQELMAWAELFDRDTQTMNPSLPNVQNALRDIFSGTGNAQTNRVHILATSRRVPTRAEKLYVKHLTAGTTGQPDTLGWEGPLRAVDVGHALRGIPLP
jgi:hypothetical protein